MLTCGQELRELRATWLKRKEEEQVEAAEAEERKEGGGGDAVVAEVLADIGAPNAFVPQNPLAAAIDTDIPSSIWQDIKHPSISRKHSSESFFNIPAATVAPTELGEEIEGSEVEQTTTRHDTFYFDDGKWRSCAATPVPDSLRHRLVLLL